MFVMADVPPEMYDELIAAAAKNNTSVAAEIGRRLLKYTETDTRSQADVICDLLDQLRKKEGIFSDGTTR